MHPSFEDRADAPDVVFAKLDDAEYELQVHAWARELRGAGAADADVLHLHHLTPLNEAAARVAPDVPVVAHLHGTELLMLEQIKAGAPASWVHAEGWAARMRRWAHAATRVVVNPTGVERARTLLELPARSIMPLDGGVDLELFTRRRVDRRAFWRRVLVEHPQGWLPGAEAGSLRYEAKDAERLAHGPALIYVGRFTAVKRLALLIESFGQAIKRTRAAASLVLVGGHPGEWEGEHPADTARRLDVPGVFLAGWYAHEDLPEFFSAADAVVLSSAREQFGQVLVEGMACGLPAVATRSLGPESIVEDGQTGWLVPGEGGALSGALEQVIVGDSERERRGAAAQGAVRRRFSWSAVSDQLAKILEEAIEDQ